MSAVAEESILQAFFSKSEDDNYVFVNEDGEEMIRIPHSTIDVTNLPLYVTANDSDGNPGILKLCLDAAILPDDYIEFVSPEEPKQIETSAGILWDRETTLLLLQEYKKHKELLEKRAIKSHKQFWASIATQFSLHGYDVSVEQTQNRWRALERIYKKAIASGHTTFTKSFSYLSELEEILGKDANVTPAVKRGIGQIVLSEQESLNLLSKNSYNVLKTHPEDADDKEEEDESMEVQDPLQNISSDIFQIKHEKDAIWDRDLTLLLIEEFKKHKNVRGIIPLKKIWSLIYEEFQKLGHNLSTYQIENRWRTLERAYKKATHRSQDGKAARPCAYQKELDDILGKRTISSSDMATSAIEIVLSEAGISPDHIYDSDSAPQQSEDMPDEDTDKSGAFIALEKICSEMGEGIEVISRKEDRYLWNNKMTHILLEQYKKYKDLVEKQSIPSYRKMWPYISDEFEQRGFSVSPAHVENRWRTLERAFKRVKDYNNQVGRPERTCAFQKDLEEILGKMHVPVKHTFPVLKRSISQIVLPEDRVKRGKTKSKVCKALEEIYAKVDENEKNRDKREEARMKRHKEKMDILNKLVAILQK